MIMYYAAFYNCPFTCEKIDNLRTKNQAIKNTLIFSQDEDDAKCNVELRALRSTKTDEEIYVYIALLILRKATMRNR